MMKETLQHSAVAKAVLAGFSKSPKRLPSWLFYDETGDKIFQAIMRMPEYYLTACEYEILQVHQAALRKRMVEAGTPFNLVELGAGDGLKTEILLKQLRDHRVPFSFFPVDVSKSVLWQLEERLRQSVPDLDIHPVHAKYQDALQALAEDKPRKVILFMGANIGNFVSSEAATFVSDIAGSMGESDQLLIGFDLKKDPRLIQAAYDDSQGITRDFNMNLLVRLNRELGAHFQLDQFRHYPYYDPESGMTRSYLVSLKAQDVTIEALEQPVHFDRWEVIHTEVSQKYDSDMIERLAESAGLVITDTFYDCKHYFCDVLLSKITSSPGAYCR
jgi:dimethylhistidine N-methyltransferase